MKMNEVIAKANKLTEAEYTELMSMLEVTA